MEEEGAGHHLVQQEVVEVGLQVLGEQGEEVGHSPCQGVEGAELQVRDLEEAELVASE